MSVLRDAFDDGKILATVDAKEYRQVTVVVERTPDNLLTVFCKADDWKTTPVAQLATLYAEIDRLRSRVAELEKVDAPLITRKPFAQGACPICGYQGVAKGVNLHMIRKHGTTPKEYARVHHLDV